MFETIGNGIFKRVGLPSFGRQDVGITPGGAMDCFALRSGNIVLGNPEGQEALELLFAPEIRFTEDVIFILTGANCQGSKLDGQPVEHGRVYLAQAGSTLRLGKKKIYGFRTYLCMKPSSAEDWRIGYERGNFDDLCGWQDTDGCIRVIEGPEHRYLNDKQAFLDNYWKITWDTSEMGMRISSDQASLNVSLENMVSEAVANGTVQLTPKGPIILLKHRQTVGGYPRIYNVISADVDLLGQFQPDQLLHFKKISLNRARAINRQKERDLNKLKKRFN